MTLTLPAAVARLAADLRTDAGLVADFVRDADQPAFAELVRRHGPMVLGVCRRTLGRTADADADDAFQATFLVLVRRARRPDWRPSLGPWLYGVAVRVARKARAARARQAAVERPTSSHTPEPSTMSVVPDDDAAILDEELAALPEAVRVPLVLCELQGVSRREAARQLGLAEGTLSSRLARGRKLLRDRLLRRGVVPAAGGLCVAVPAELARATASRAVAVLTNAAGAVPAAVLSLTDGVTKMMTVSTWKLAAVLAAGVGVIGYGAASGPTPAAADPPAKEAKEKAAEYTVHIREETAPERVIRVPLADGVTVLDAVDRLKRDGELTVGDLAGVNMWVVRPVAGRKPQTLPIDWVGLTEWGITATNYQVLAGDRLFVRCGPPVAAADPPAKETKAPPADGRVATVAGRPVTKDEYADFLIRRGGKAEFERFVTNRVIAAAFAAKGLTLSDDEVRAGSRWVQRAHRDSPAGFGRDLLRHAQQTPARYVEDVHVLRIMLRKLCADRVTPPTDEELRRAFAERWGEQLSCRLAVWPKAEAAAARAAYPKVRTDEAAFAERYGWKYLFGVGISRGYARVRLFPSADPVEEAARKLKPGEVTPLIEATDETAGVEPGSWVVVKCDRVDPPHSKVTLETHRSWVVRDVAEAKMEREMEKLTAELMRAAGPEYHLTFPAGK